VRDFLGQHGTTICGPYSRQDAGGSWRHDTFDNLSGWLVTPFNKSATNNRRRIPIIGCPGDFVMMHRDAISAMRGYPEVPIPTGLDDVIIVAAVHLGLDCVSTMLLMLLAPRHARVAWLGWQSSVVVEWCGRSGWTSALHEADDQ
jgi:hypothetical protein